MMQREAEQTALRWAQTIISYIVRALMSGTPTKITINVKSGDRCRIEVSSSVVIE